jgi:hypothetical protein
MSGNKLLLGFNFGRNLRLNLDKAGVPLFEKVELLCGF